MLLGCFFLHPILLHLRAGNTAQPSATKTAASILPKVKKQTQAEAKAISQMFLQVKTKKATILIHLQSPLRSPKRKKKRKRLFLQRKISLQILKFSC
jgi:hypothetical protein